MEKVNSHWRIVPGHTCRVRDSKEKASRGGMGRGAQQLEGLLQPSNIYRALPERRGTRLTAVIPPTRCLSKCISQSDLKITLWGWKMTAVTKDAWRSFPSWPKSSGLEAHAGKVDEGFTRVGDDHGEAPGLSVWSVRMEVAATRLVLEIPYKEES